MKSWKKIVAIMMIVFGILLFLVGALFRISSWPDTFHSLYIGPILFVLGVIFLTSLKKSKI